MAVEHFPRDTKTVDALRRPFHRINAPNYDVAVDTDPARRGSKQAPAGNARASGARGPEAFQDSGFLKHVTELVGKLTKPLLGVIPGVGPVILAIDLFIGKLTGTSPIDALIGELGKLISSGVEGALFARYMRAIPAWVPVARVGYENRFRYQDDGATRETTVEEEREVEGFLTGSYLLCNDTVFTQWTQARHWSFQVMPAHGYRYVVGQGNIPDPKEQEFMNRAEDNLPRFAPFMATYGQNPGRLPDQVGAIECLMDVGALSKPIGDFGTHGLMFDANWPYWPMTGDYFWATGRWGYDCMRASGADRNEVFPTQINPIKAFASARLEGFKFPENRFGVPATRFFFFASSSGGFTDFHTTTDRNGTAHPSGIALDGRDYEFIVDLPPHDETRSPHAVGATIDFPLNTLVLRPRLLITVRQAPFGGLSSLKANELQFVTVTPEITVLRPDDPTRRPTQARVKIPLSALGPHQGEKDERAVALDIALGWHDPNGDDASTLFRVVTEIRTPKFFSRSGKARLVSAINGRFHMHAARVEQADIPTNLTVDTLSNAGFVHRTETFLPADARLRVATSGTWLRGFGEFMEENDQEKRKLKVGGALIDLPPGTKDRIQKMIDETRKTINDVKANIKDAREAREALKRELQKKIDDLKAKSDMNDPKTKLAVDQLEAQLLSLMNNLPDTPDALKTALDALDGRLNQLLDGLGALEDFFRITDDLIGESFTPDWPADIDAAVKTGVDESKRVSALSRSMFLHPTPIVNKADEPMGWAEFVNLATDDLGRNEVHEFKVEDRVTNGTIRQLLGPDFDRGRTFTRVALVAPRTSIVGSGNNLGRANTPRTSEAMDYGFVVHITIDPQLQRANTNAVAGANPDAGAGAGAGAGAPASDDPTVL